VIVLDASAVVELLLWTERGERVAQVISDPSESLHAPHLLSIEVAQAMRRLASAGEVSGQRAANALQDLVDLDVNHYEHQLLLPRIWQLRENLTASDAAYVALAESLDCPVMTFDRRLVDNPVTAATFVVP
jgi:predicted nucleic acid-binding protein